FLLTGSISGYIFFKPPEFYALVLGLSGFFISYLLIRFISSKMAGSRKFTPEIIRILKP
ncbi:MAG: SoxR reducing system RseC family protein, partial [Candidatus Aminicenantes bacterium]|nr:SoxR reducing system RseC family protein [Candidatus Aminicenantes bacterium]